MREMLERGRERAPFMPRCICADETAILATRDGAALFRQPVDLNLEPHPR